MRAIQLDEYTRISFDGNMLDVMAIQCTVEYVLSAHDGVYIFYLHACR